MNLEKIILHGESETAEFKESLQLKDILRNLGMEL